MTGGCPAHVSAIRVEHATELDVVHTSGAVDLAVTPALRAVLLDRLTDGVPWLVVDVSDVHLLAADGVGMLHAVARRGRKLGGRLSVRGAAGTVHMVLEITADAKRLGLDDDDDPIPALTDPDTGWQDQTVESLLSARSRQPVSHETGDWLREEAVRHSQRDAIRLARRYQGRGEALDDLVQVAMVGLLKSVDGYDPARGHPFLAYATPTIVGELRRHFRDRGWRIRVPRRLQELSIEIAQTRGAVTQALGRSPTVAELARHIGTGEDEVLEALDARGGYRPVSLFAPLGNGADESLADRLGANDPGFAAIDDRESLRLVVARLPLRQQRIVALRFFGNRTQSEIADELGISQMHVSRLLAGALRDLRAGLVEA
jgi:RNA polymerase sigma-B factor